MLKKLILFILFLNFIFCLNNSSIHIDFYYWSSCPHCHKVLNTGLLNDLKEKGFNVTLYEISSSENNERMENLQKYYNNITHNVEIGGVPFLVVYEKNPYDGIAIQGDEEIIKFLKKLNSSNYSQIKKEEFSTKKNLKKNDYIGKLILAITLGAADSINPCIMAILVLLLSILSKYDVDKAVKYGLLFTTVVFISYYLIGVLLYLGLNLIITKFSLMFGKIILSFTSLVILIIGILNIKESIFPQGILKIPESQLNQVKKLIEEGTFLAILTLGTLITIIEFPCSGIMYLGFAAAFIATKSSIIEYLIYLIIYNIIFILPLLIIIYGFKKSQDIEKYKEIRLKYRRVFRFIMGIVMIFLAIWLIFHYNII